MIMAGITFGIQSSGEFSIHVLVLRTESPRLPVFDIPLPPSTISRVATQSCESQARLMLGAIC